MNGGAAFPDARWMTFCKPLYYFFHRLIQRLINFNATIWWCGMMSALNRFAANTFFLGAVQAMHIVEPSALNSMICIFKFSSLVHCFSRHILIIMQKFGVYRYVLTKRFRRFWYWILIKCEFTCHILGHLIKFDVDIVKRGLLRSYYKNLPGHLILINITII